MINDSGGKDQINAFNYSFLWQNLNYSDENDLYIGIIYIVLYSFLIMSVFTVIKIIYIIRYLNI
jgi:hypothetical protein